MTSLHRALGDIRAAERRLSEVRVAGEVDAMASGNAFDSLRGGIAFADLADLLRRSVSAGSPAAFGDRFQLIAPAARSHATPAEVVDDEAGNLGLDLDDLLGRCSAGLILDQDREDSFVCRGCADCETCDNREACGLLTATRGPVVSPSAAPARPRAPPAMCFYTACDDSVEVDAPDDDLSDQEYFYDAAEENSIDLDGIGGISTPGDVAEVSRILMQPLPKGARQQLQHEDFPRSTGADGHPSENENPLASVLLCEGAHSTIVDPDLSSSQGDGMSSKGSSKGACGGEGKEKEENEHSSDHLAADSDVGTNLGLAHFSSPSPEQSFLCAPLGKVVPPRKSQLQDEAVLVLTANRDHLKSATYEPDLEVPSLTGSRASATGARANDLLSESGTMALSGVQEGALVEERAVVEEGEPDESVASASRTSTKGASRGVVSAATTPGRGSKRSVSAVQPKRKRASKTASKASLQRAKTVLGAAGLLSKQNKPKAGAEAGTTRTSAKASIKRSSSVAERAASIDDGEDDLNVMAQRNGAENQQQIDRFEKELVETENQGENTMNEDERENASQRREKKDTPTQKTEGVPKFFELQQVENAMSSLISALGGYPTDAERRELEDVLVEKAVLCGRPTSHSPRSTLRSIYSTTTRLGPEVRHLKLPSRSAERAIKPAYHPPARVAPPREEPALVQQARQSTRTAAAVAKSFMVFYPEKQHLAGKTGTIPFAEQQFVFDPLFYDDGGPGSGNKVRSSDVENKSSEQHDVATRETTTTRFPDPPPLTAMPTTETRFAFHLKMLASPHLGIYEVARLPTRNCVQWRNAVYSAQSLVDFFGYALEAARSDTADPDLRSCVGVLRTASDLLGARDVLARKFAAWHFFADSTVRALDTQDDAQGPSSIASVLRGVETFPPFLLQQALSQLSFVDSDARRIEKGCRVRMNVLDGAENDGSSTSAIAKNAKTYRVAQVGFAWEEVGGISDLQEALIRTGEHVVVNFSQPAVFFLEGTGEDLELREIRASHVAAGGPEAAPRDHGGALLAREADGVAGAPMVFYPEKSSGVAKKSAAPPAGRRSAVPVRKPLEIPTASSLTSQAGGPAPTGKWTNHASRAYEDALRARFGRSQRWSVKQERLASLTLPKREKREINVFRGPPGDAKKVEKAIDSLSARADAAAHALTTKRPECKVGVNPPPEASCPLSPKKYRTLRQAKSASQLRHELRGARKSSLKVLFYPEKEPQPGHRDEMPKKQMESGIPMLDEAVAELLNAGVAAELERVYGTTNEIVFEGPTEVDVQEDRGSIMIRQVGGRGDEDRASVARASEVEKIGGVVPPQRRTSASEALNYGGDDSAAVLVVEGKGVVEFQDAKDVHVKVNSAKNEWLLSESNDVSSDWRKQMQMRSGQQYSPELDDFGETTGVLLSENRENQQTSSSERQNFARHKYRGRNACPGFYETADALVPVWSAADWRFAERFGTKRASPGLLDLETGSQHDTKWAWVTSHTSAIAAQNCAGKTVAVEARAGRNAGGAVRLLRGHPSTRLPPKNRGLSPFRVQPGGAERNNMSPVLQHGRTSTATSKVGDRRASAAEVEVNVPDNVVETRRTDPEPDLTPAPAAVVAAEGEDKVPPFSGVGEQELTSSLTAEQRMFLINRAENTFIQYPSFNSTFLEQQKQDSVSSQTVMRMTRVVMLSDEEGVEEDFVLRSATGEFSEIRRI